MADDHSRIRIGDNEIGLMGLKSAFEEIAHSHADASDEEIRNVLIERLARNNYIPCSVRNEYGKAFVREFRKFLGQPYEAPHDGPVRVAVLGPGCSQCNHLEQIVMQVLNEMKLPAALEHVTDIKEMASYGLVRTPALAINGKIMAMGTVPSPKKIRTWLAELTDPNTTLA
ncbi:MAG: thioredoxin family protein [Desulfomonile tiedjei]|nr:thioredoxin family protein [Desulfomonile tiedjei]